MSQYLSITIKGITEFGDRRISFGSWSLLASVTTYPAASTYGMGFTAADMGLASVDAVMMEPKLGYTFTYNYSSGTVQVFAGYGNNEQSASAGFLATPSSVRWFAIGGK